MTIDDLAKAAGILGFLISVATFALTRWERRAVVIFGLDEGSADDFGITVDEPISTINLTISNVGARSLHLDLRTLQIEATGNTLSVWREDHLGGEQREVLLKPNDSKTIGIFLDTFRDVLKIESPRKYDEHSFNFMQPLRISVVTTNGKVFASKKLKYWEATGEFHHA
ncbi:MAG: hypothetical protein KGJ63_02890 [Pseudomonadota bacterium]|nr:hypothetical protein [Pseudomonadota bacterium]